MELQAVRYKPSPGIVPPHLNPSPVPELSQRRLGLTPLDMLIERPTSHEDSTYQRDGYGRMRIDELERRVRFSLAREALR